MLTLFSPAKINLFLRVTGRRDDGYHELSTLMQAIDLGDHITLSFSKTDFFCCNSPSIACDSSNLVWRALQLFRKKTGHLDPVRMILDKKIPVQAGLGGGSGNAATTLWGLNRLFGSPVEESLLRSWSVELGADVPFFFSPGTAHCRGIGEDVQPGSYPPSHFFLHKPLCGLSTKLIFQHFDLALATKEDCFFQNDLEPIALKMCSPLKALKEKLTPYYETLFMTGSGTTLVGMGGSHPKGIRVQSIQRDLTDWYYSWR